MFQFKSEIVTHICKIPRFKKLFICLHNDWILGMLGNPQHIERCDDLFSILFTYNYISFDHGTFNVWLRSIILDMEFEYKWLSML